jgi:hypothetical protein
MMNFECFFWMYFLYINIKIRRFFEKTIDDFLAYFKREKLEATQNWYETVAMCVPSTSNGIESNNRNIKEDDTFRERWPLGRFCVKSLDIVRNWSADRNPTNVNCKNFNFHPILETKEWKNPYSWLKSSLSKTLVRAEQEGDYQLYFTKSATAGDFTLNKSFISKYKSQLKNPKKTILIFIRTLSLFYGSYGYIKMQTRPIGWKI